MSDFQTPDEIAASYFTNTEMRNALRSDIEDLYDVKGAEIRSGCAIVAKASATALKTPDQIKSDVESMSLPVIEIEP